MKLERTVNEMARQGVVPQPVDDYTKLPELESLLEKLED